MKPGVKMIRFPEELAPETFIGGGCGLVTALHAVDRARSGSGSRSSCSAWDRWASRSSRWRALSGAGEVIAIGAPDDRLAFARRMGATRPSASIFPRHEPKRDGRNGASGASRADAASTS